MKELDKVFSTGTHISCSVNTPCGYTLVEGAVVAKVADSDIRIVFPATVKPRLNHIPVGTQISVSTEIGDNVFAYNGIICSHEERPFVRVRLFERLQAMEKRIHRRISVRLPIYCSVVDNTGAFRVIHEAKKVDGRHVSEELSLSAGGFKVKTPFHVQEETMAIVVFIYPDETERVVPVLSKSVYSYPAPSGKNFLTGFKFSLINEHDRENIDNLVKQLFSADDPGHSVRKYPSCLARIRNH